MKTVDVAKIAGPPKADWIRSVPEIAVRIVLGADVVWDDGQGGCGIVFEGKATGVAIEVLREAVELGKSLPKIKGVVNATYILELRFRAEELWVNKLLPKCEATVLMMPVHDSAAGYYRMKLPAAILRSRGKVVAQWAETLDPGKALRFDTLWIQLETAPIVHETIKAVQKKGVKVIFDLDDDFTQIPPWHPLTQHYNTQEKIDAWWRMIEEADCVTVCSEPLLELVRSRAKRAEILPYCVLTRGWPERLRKEDGTVRILWLGSASHGADLDLIAPALEGVCRRRPNVRVICAGSEPPKSFNRFADQVDLMPWGLFEDYMERVAALGCDIALVPLVDHPFNRSKSGLKVLEHMCWGHLVLASPVAEYPKLIRHGETGYLVGNWDWEKDIDFAVSELVPSGKAALIAEQGRQWVIKNRDIEHWISKWEAVVLALKGK